MKSLIIVTGIIAVISFSGCSVDPYRDCMERTQPTLNDSERLIVRYVPDTERDKDQVISNIRSSRAAIKEALKKE